MPVEPPEPDPPTARRPGEDGQLVPQQQVLRYQIALPPAGRTYQCEDAQGQIKHWRSIANLVAIRYA